MALGVRLGGEGNHQAYFEINDDGDHSPMRQPSASASGSLFYSPFLKIPGNSPYALFSLDHALHGLRLLLGKNKSMILLFSQPFSADW